jgi:hypothetical protein
VKTIDQAVCQTVEGNKAAHRLVTVQSGRVTSGAFQQG